ncbi:MAG: hypothetical protein J0L70_23045 [Leptolyngbya sp. UWPOB_LEPTO1]|uniref:hypothetical protein n=1 Tax=Leptolyngbya sp. UWPOB_LEPTO1 TaxID=2815653 RepID=UPI001ACA12D9|nr:hypothetical protein [Leptolyngbya sp. UWPOB_LEPTO1]MBN8563417.1 hypothetical protein [Leptolyngbya sp. UWPOB_LEPTO1]
MAHNSLIFTIDCADSRLDSEEQDQLVQRLLREIKEHDDTARIRRCPDSDLPNRSKSLGGFLVGLLTVEVSSANAKKLLQFLGDRFGNKPLKLKLETAKGQKLEIEASSREEFEYIMQQAQSFIEET